MKDDELQKIYGKPPAPKPLPKGKRWPNQQTALAAQWGIQAGQDIESMPDGFLAGVINHALESVVDWDFITQVNAPPVEAKKRLAPKDTQDKKSISSLAADIVIKAGAKK